MKKPYQIEAQRAIKQLDAMAADGNLAVRVILPMAEMMGWLQKGVSELVRPAGLQLMDLMMQEEIRELAGGAQPAPSGSDGPAMVQRARLLSSDGGRRFRSCEEKKAS